MWVTTLSAIVGCLVGAFTIPGSRLKLFAVFLVALIPFLLYLVPRFLTSKYWRVGSPILVGAALLLGGLWVIHLPTSAQKPQPPPSITPAAVKYTIYLPDRPLPLCNQLSGTGKIPPNKVLLIFDREANANMTDGAKGAEYFLDGAAANKADGSGWHLDDVSAGAPGGKFEMVAELASPQLIDFFQSITYSVTDAKGMPINHGGPGTTWLSTTLPEGPPVATAFGQRDTTNNPCP